MIIYNWSIYNLIGLKGRLRKVVSDWSIIWLIVIIFNWSIFNFIGKKKRLSKVIAKWLSVIEVLFCVLRLSKLIANLFDEYIVDCFTALHHNLLITSMVCEV